MQVKFTVLDPDAKVPHKNYGKGDAGFDIYTLPSVLPVRLLPGESTLLPTGLAVEYEPEYAMVVENRSGNATKGLVVGACVVDSNYRGEVKLDVHNISDRRILLYDVDPEVKDEFLMDQIYHIDGHSAIAQVLFYRVEHPEWVMVDRLSDTKRSSNMLGSSNKREGVE